MKALKNFFRGELKENLVVIRIAVYGGLTRGPPIPPPVGFATV